MKVILTQDVRGKGKRGCFACEFSHFLSSSVADFYALMPAFVKSNLKFASLSPAK